MLSVPSACGPHEIFYLKEFCSYLTLKISESFSFDVTKRNTVLNTSCSDCISFSMRAVFSFLVSAI